jgi:hypothetical protein
MNLKKCLRAGFLQWRTHFILGRQFQDGSVTLKEILQPFSTSGRMLLQGGLKGGTAIGGPPERGLRVAAGIGLRANPAQVTEMEEAQRIAFCLPFFRISLSLFGDNIDHEDILLADETASSY